MGRHRIVATTPCMQPSSSLPAISSTARPGSLSETRRRGPGNPAGPPTPLPRLENSSPSLRSRMLLDATLNPSMLSLRMNNQNLKNEMLVYKGRTVSHQFALMRPRPKATCATRQLELPAHCIRSGVDKLARRQKRRQSVAFADVSHERSGEHRFVNAPESVGMYLSRAASPEVEEASETTGGVDGEGGLVNHTRVCHLLRDGSLAEAMLPFERAPGDGVDSASVHKILGNIGLGVFPQDMVENAICQVTEQHFCSLEDLAQVVSILEDRQLAELRKVFKALDVDRSGSVSSNELRHILWDRGFTVGTDVVEEILAEVDGDNTGEVEFPEFANVMRIISERCGFTNAEATQLFKLFDGYDSQKNGLISPNELAGLLGYVGTPTSIQQAAKIISEFDADQDGHLGRAEFLQVMRFRLEQEISDMRFLFGRFDLDHRGSISFKTCQQLLHSLNYSVFPDVLNEAVRECLQDASASDELFFEDVVQIVAFIRKQEGFATAEVAELEAVFRMHDTQGNGHIREFELARALNWLGYPLSYDRRRKYWRRVDVDKSDNIGCSEFLKVIRLIRENETLAGKSLLKTAAAEGWTSLREPELRDMFNKLGYAIAPELLMQALKQAFDTIGDTVPDLLGIVAILRSVREGQVERFRMSAGLPDHLALRVQSTFAIKVEAGKAIEPTEVESFMYEVFKPARHSEKERRHVKKIIEENSTNEALDLVQICWVVRQYGDEVAEESWQREQEVAAAAGFTTAQVAQFRTKFVKATNGSGFLTGMDLQDVFDDILSLNKAQVFTLHKELDEIGDRQGCIEFPEFLRLMRVVIGGYAAR
mmetsp:Transcript_30617/g.84169  ORF Transcript_30617/g.84169 Transcript_30617/m.84169 type:complete len:823 (-) Transcript_30617:149-2617(-)